MVADRPQGRAVWYRIAEPEVAAVIHAAEDLLARTSEHLDLERAPIGDPPVVVVARL